MIIASNVFAQDNWARYSWGTPGREGFTVLLPAIPEQVTKENGEQGISAFVDFVRFEVTFRDAVGKQELDRQIRAAGNIVGSGQGTGSPRSDLERGSNSDSVTKDISTCGYGGTEVVTPTSVQQFFQVRDRTYHVSVTGAKRSDPSVEKFLRSFTLIKPWQLWTGLRTNDGPPGLGTGGGLPFEPDPCKNIDTIKKAILPTNSALKLISKPRPAYPEEVKKKQIQGSVSLKVMFLKDGTIGPISVVKRLDKALDESAMRAAKQIKFEPERKNGKPVNSTRTIEYNFAIY